MSSILKKVLVAALASAGVGVATTIGIKKLYEHFLPEDIQQVSMSFLLSVRDIPHIVWLAVQNKRMRNMCITALLFTLLLSRSRHGNRLQSKPFLMFFAFVYAMYYRWGVVEKAVVTYQRTLWNTQLVQKSKLAKIAYKPFFWGFNRHTMTIFVVESSKLDFIYNRTIEWKREAIEPADGGKVFLDWAHFPETREVITDSSRPIILLIHGIGGDRSDPYIRRMSIYAHENGFRPVMFFYWKLDWSESFDLMVAINHIASIYPHAPIIAIGYSAGCHKLTKYLQMSKEKSPLVAAITVSGVLNLNRAYNNVYSNESRVYKMWMDECMQKIVRRHLEYDEELSDIARSEIKIAAMEMTTGDKLYDRFTHIRLCDELNRQKGLINHSIPPWRYMGETTREHHTKHAEKYMKAIKVTTLMIHSQDDPIVPSSTIDWDKIVENKNIIVSTTNRGGHVGWIDGLTPYGPTWHDKIAINFISAVLETHAQTNFMVSVIREGLKHRPSLSGEISPAAIARICSVSDVPGLPAFVGVKNSKSAQDGLSRTKNFFRSGAISFSRSSSLSKNDDDSAPHIPSGSTTASSSRIASFRKNSFDGISADNRSPALHAIRATSNISLLKKSQSVTGGVTATLIDRNDK